MNINDRDQEYTVLETVNETQRALYDEYLRDIVENGYMTAAEKHFIIQYTKFVKGGYRFGDDEWTRTTDLEAGAGGDDYPQYIEFADDIEFADEYDVKISSYKRCFIEYQQTDAGWKSDDMIWDEEDDLTNEYYAYNMFKNFEFRNFTGDVSLRGV
jgi:hypothetical protein